MMMPADDSVRPMSIAIISYDIMNHDLLIAGTCTTLRCRPKLKLNYKIDNVVRICKFRCQFDGKSENTISALTVPSPIFQNGNFICRPMLEIFTHQFLNPKFQLNRSNCWDVQSKCKLQLPLLNCVSSVMVTILDHIFTDISPREHLFVVKFLVGIEKNMGHLLEPKSQEV